MTRNEFIHKWGQYVRASAPTGPKEIARIREFIDDVDELLPRRRTRKAREREEVPDGTPA